MSKADQPPRPERSNTPQDLVQAAARAGAQLPPAITISTQIAMQQQSGPLPPPEILKKYNEIDPGMALQIVNMAKDEANHRRKMEAEVMLIQGRDQISQRRSELLGQIFGLLIALAGIGGSVYEAAHGAQLAATALVSATLIAIVSAFILGRQALLKLKEQDFKHQRDIQSQLAGDESTK